LIYKTEPLKRRGIKGVGMRVTSLRLHSFRSFSDSGPIALGPINVLIGANNSGKSSLLRALYLLQLGSDPAGPDVRVGASSSSIQLELDDVTTTDLPSIASLAKHGTVTISVSSTDRKNTVMSLNFQNSSNNSSTNFSQIPNLEPQHFVVPYLSKRKTATFHEDVRDRHAKEIVSSMTYLAAKLSRLSNPSFPEHEAYSSTCKAILGFLVTAIPSDSGQRPGIYLPNRETIPIDQMGEGVPNIVTLLADLALAKGKLFLIEEPENDLHPTALKALLDLIVSSSENNQFVVSTHSNIVLRHLGAADSSRVYSIVAQHGVLPTVAEVHEVERTPEARLKVLRDLGYSFSDFDLWDGWLILEEASAERIIRDYLIPWFVPTLSRVRTLSTGGTGKMEATFEDFHRLARFTHLEQAYKGAAWVRADGDASGKAIVEQLQKAYATWKPEQFKCFSESQFEKYYPAEFEGRATRVLEIVDKQQKREAKRLLLDEVRLWLDEDSKRGREALQKSAGEIIADLKMMAITLKPP
jgi:predicted ATPase